MDNKVLIVDDDRVFLTMLEKQLKSYDNIFTPLYAKNGQGAVDILSQQDISLVVTDLVMPGDVDGWALVEHIEKKHSDVPCLVMTSATDTEEIKQLYGKVRHIFFKPIEVGELAKAISAILDEDLTTGSLKGFSVVSFLQLLEMDRKTCLLEISSSEKDRGMIYLNKGVLYDAVYGDLKGHEAACRLIAKDNAHLQLKDLPKKKIRRQIESPLMGVIMEAMRLKDENLLNNQKGENNNKSILAEENGVVFDLAESDTQQHSQEKQNHQAGESISHLKQKEINLMALETNLETLRDIKGYKAAAVMNFTGEVLALDSVDDNVDLANVGAVFNDIFRSSHEASGKVGLKACTELTIKTPDGLVVMACSGVDAPVHFHLITIMDADGNQALAKMQLDKLTPIIMEELS